MILNQFLEVDDTGIEPVTPTMSMWCSTAEPIVLGVLTIKPLRIIFLCGYTVVEVGTGFEPV